MKKTIAFLLVLVSALTPVLAFAEDSASALGSVRTYIAQLSTDDLLEMKGLIEEELQSRGASSEGASPKEFYVPSGKYTVGIDFPAGTYTATYSGELLAMIVVGDYEAYYNVMSDNPVGKIELAEGQTIDVQYGGVTFSEYKGIGF